MIFDPSSAPHLKPWLVRTLEPICDAEPGALADYILALLKHNVPEAEMRKELDSQLEEFLEKECKSFIDTLFTVLRTKSYLPYSPPTPPPPGGSQSTNDGIPIPLDALMAESSRIFSERIRKRSSSTDERDGRPKKGPRLNNDPAFSRYGNGGWGGQQFGAFPPGGMENYGMQMAMGLPMSAMGPMPGRHAQGYQPPGQKRGTCRDYHNNGFCSRGELCKFSHGEDAVVPSQIYPGMMPMNYLYNLFNPNLPYDPNDPQGSRQNQRAPVLPRIQQENGSRIIHLPHTSGELPVIQDLTPSDAVKNQQPSNGQSISQLESTTVPITSNGFNLAMYPSIPNFGGMPQYPGMPMDVNSMASGEGGPARPLTENFRGRGGGRGRGTFGADASSFRPGRRGDKTLVVEKIPDDKLSLEQVNTWFKKFGTVTNVAVDTAGAKALVSFAAHEEAHAAWKSEDAVFGNRFVKVFWHRPMEGHGQVGQRALAASAPLVANMTSKDNSPIPSSSSASVPQIAASSSSSSSKKPPGQPGAPSALAAKQELLEKQILEQKSLMTSLSTATPEAKRDIMSRLRKLNEEMQMTSSSTPNPLIPSKKPTPAVDSEEKERQRLDKELENHGNVDGEESTDQLKAKLEKLKVEAASLGISEAGAELSYQGYRGGYRGRARGRGFYRGGPALRGGPPRGSLKLDNRPKKLLVKGAEGDEGVQVVKEWFEASGQVESTETVDDGDVLVSFKSRAAAEQGLAKGTTLPKVGKVTISWFTGKHSAVTTNNSATPTSPSPALPSRDVDDPMEPSQPHQEEEVIATGWGDDDGDGMGML